VRSAKGSDSCSRDPSLERSAQTGCSFKLAIRAQNFKLSDIAIFRKPPMLFTHFASAVVAGCLGQNLPKGEYYEADLEQQVPGFWREDRHLSFFLAFLALMTIFVPMVGESRQGRLE
jgi:hypothetical protein